MSSLLDFSRYLGYQQALGNYPGYQQGAFGGLQSYYPGLGQASGGLGRQADSLFLNMRIEDIREPLIKPKVFLSFKSQLQAEVDEWLKGVL